jgi:hypothetical protein
VPSFASVNFSPQKTFHKDADISELARDLRAAFLEIPLLKIVTIEGQYTEPMAIGYDHEPAGVMVLRVQNVRNSAEVPLRSGGTVHFVWDGTRKRCRIDSIDGMTPLAGATYRFTFLMIG